MNRMSSSALLVLLTITLLLAGCSNKPYGHYRDDQMIGFISSLNEQEKMIQFDVSEWTKRDEKGPGINDWGAIYDAKLLPSTLIRNDAGDKLDWKDLKLGQKVQINPPKTKRVTDTPDELIILTMSDKELYERAGLLASKNGSFRTTVLYENGQNEPFEVEEIDKKANIILNGGYRSLVYNPNYVLDMKKEFSIESFPVILVFDTKKLAMKSDQLEDIVAFLNAK